MNTKDKAPLPVFIKADKIPGDVNTYEICSAAEEVSGPVTIDGAICISGLWRISPLYEASRIKILANGIPIRGRTVGVESINPFTLRGDESAGTKLYIGNLPFSYSSEAVKKHLQAAGITLRSDVVWEKARGPDGSLSDWKTGRRMVWINVPLKPLNKFLKMGNGFSAVLYYKEMKESRRCNKCLKYGHIAKYCENEEVCYTCNKTGHKKGDPVCDLGRPDSENEYEEVEHSHNDSGPSRDSDDHNERNIEKETCEADDCTEEVDDDKSDSSISDWETSDEIAENENELNLQTATAEIPKNSEQEKKSGHSKNNEPKEPSNQKKGKNKNVLDKKSPPKSQTKLKSKKKKDGKKDSQKPPSFKQSQITEFTPSGKRDGSAVFSPDTATSGHGPLTKKPNTKK